MKKMNEDKELMIVMGMTLAFSFGYFGIICLFL